jgi:glycosyltransferase involved in cell wall biosynthesis
MTKIGIITGDLKRHTTGMSTYAFQIIDGVKKKAAIDIIRHGDGDMVPECHSVIPRTIPGPFWYLSWSLSLTYRPKQFKKYDLVHNIAQYPISPDISKKYVITVYDLIPILYPQYVTPIYAFQSRLFLPTILKKATRILTISNHTKNDIVKRFNIPHNIIDVTPLGVSDHFHPVTKKQIESLKSRYNLHSPFILFIGAIEPKKNIQVLIRSFYRCIQQQPDLILVIAGKKSWKYQDIFNLILELKLENRIKYLDFIPYSDLPALYSSAEVFVFPSKYEGFGLPPLEAMKCGTPVIVSNRSSLPEIVGPTGLMVDPDDEEGLFKLILQILSDKDFKDKQSKYSLSQSSLFSWDICVNKTLECYEKAIND